MRGLPLSFRQVWGLTKQTAGSWSKDYAPSMGAALSYYTLFSIAPLLVIVIAVAGLVFGADAVQGVIIAQLASLMGDESAQAIQEMLGKASRPKTGAIATAVSIFGLLIGATTVFNELQSDLDRIWRRPAEQTIKGMWKLLRTRLLSFGMILGFVFLLTVSLVTSAALSALGKWWGGYIAWEILAHVLDFVVNFGVLTLMFALIYKMIPRVDVAWSDVWVGAGVTAFLFVVGKFLIGLYLGKSDVASNFGAFGSVVLLMLWVYYSAQIFLFGAEFTWVYANEYGSRRGEAKAETPAPASEKTASPESEGHGQIAPVPPIDWDKLGARSRAGAHAFAAHDRARIAASALAPVRRHKHVLALLAGAGAAIGLRIFRRWKNNHTATA